MMNLLHKRFQLQLLFALIAAISVAALTIELVANAVRHAESFVLVDTNQALSHALDELDREYRLRRHDDNSSWNDLPASAQELTLRAISTTVLASYPGVEGGFWEASTPIDTDEPPGKFIGYSYPTHDGGSLKIDVPAAEKSAIEGVIQKAEKQGKSERVLRGKYDLVVISAISANSSDGHRAAWAMKRLPGQAEPSQRQESILLTALVGAALLGAAGVLATGVGLNRGIAQITTGLAALEKDFSPDLPVRRDELGRVSAAINEMARTRRRLESEVRREDRVRTIGHFVGRIAHEMRNPLNSIRLSLQMLAQRHDQARLRSGDFQMVIDEVDRINNLLADLLAFQQPRPPKLEALPVNQILESCTQLVKPQAEERGIEVVIEAGFDRSALLDERYIRQILVNLILNAIAVSKRGDQVTIRAKETNRSLAIEVSDQGPGLTIEQQEHIFEPFYTTKTTGHGLGLAVSRELAQSMGASLSWRNEQGVGEHRSGATFVLQLNREIGELASLERGINGK